MSEARQAVSDFFGADVTRAVLGVLLTGGTLLLLVLQRDIPDGWWVLCAAAVGFFFGGVTRPTGGY